MTAKKWFIKFIIFVCILLSIMTTVVCLYDPLLLYKDTSQTALLNARNSIPGVIRNKDYDTAIIGSSLAENIKLEEIRRNTDWNPIMLTMPAMYITEMEDILELAHKEDAYDRYIITLDIFPLRRESLPDSRFDKYMFDDVFYNDYEYWWGYNTWTALLPVDIGISILETLDVKVPNRITEKTGFDYMGYWAQLYSFNEDSVKSLYEKGIKNNKEIINTGEDDGETYILTAETGKINIDIIFENIKKYCVGKQVNLYFPPYSALYMLDMQNSGEYTSYMELRSYAVTLAEEYDYISVYDFQSGTDISNLNNYYDKLHPSPEVMTKIIEDIYNTENVATVKNIEHKNKQISKSVEKLKNEHNDWLKGLGVI